MSNFTQIIREELEVTAEDFPAEPDDETAWHISDKDLQALLARVAERVEEQMLDAVEVGRHMGQLSIERNDYKRRLEALSETHACELVKSLKFMQERDHARGLIAKVIQELPTAGKDNDEAYAVWRDLLRACDWLKPRGWPWMEGK